MADKDKKIKKMIVNTFGIVDSPAIDVGFFAVKAKTAEEKKAAGEKDGAIIELFYDSNDKASLNIKVNGKQINPTRFVFDYLKSYEEKPVLCGYSEEDSGNPGFSNNFTLKSGLFITAQEGGETRMTVEETKAAELKAAEDKKVAEQKAADEKAIADKAIADKKIADDKAAEEAKAAAEKKPALPEEVITALKNIATEITTLCGASEKPAAKLNAEVTIDATSIRAELKALTESIAKAKSGELDEVKAQIKSLSEKIDAIPVRKGSAIKTKEGEESDAEESIVESPSVKAESTASGKIRAGIQLLHDKVNKA